MKKYFSQLRPMERRLVVGVAVVVFLVLNAVFVWPHRSDWSDLSARLDKARTARWQPQRQPRPRGGPEFGE